MKKPTQMSRKEWKYYRKNFKKSKQKNMAQDAEKFSALLTRETHGDVRFNKNKSQLDYLWKDKYQDVRERLEEKSGPRGDNEASGYGKTS